MVMDSWQGKIDNELVPRLLNDKNGKPYLFFSGKTEKYINEKEKELRRKFIFNISLSDERKYVIAFVVISLAPFV